MAANSRNHRPIRLEPHCCSTSQLFICHTSQQFINLHTGWPNQHFIHKFIRNFVLCLQTAGAFQKLNFKSECCLKIYDIKFCMQRYYVESFKFKIFIIYYFQDGILHNKIVCILKIKDNILLRSILKIEDKILCFIFKIRQHLAQH